MVTEGYRPFTTILTPESGDTEYNTGAKIAAFMEAGKTATSHIKIWEKTIPAQQGLRFGYGTPQFQFNQGIMSFACVDKSVANSFLDGELELRLVNASGTVIRLHSRHSTAAMHAASRAANAPAAQALLVNRNEATPLPESGEMVYEDSRIELWFKPISAVGTAFDDVAFRIPATIYSA